MRKPPAPAHVFGLDAGQLNTAPALVRVFLLLSLSALCQLPRTEWEIRRMRGHWHSLPCCRALQRHLTELYQTGDTTKAFQVPRYLSFSATISLVRWECSSFSWLILFSSMLFQRFFLAMRSALGMSSPKFSRCSLARL